MVKLSKQRGATNTELIVLLLLVGIIATVAINHILILRVDAERNVFKMNVSIMRRALSYHVAIQKASGKPIKPLAYSNPLKLLRITPSNYLGRVIKPNYPSLKDNGWLYDASQKSLIYIPKHPAYVMTPDSKPKRIIIQILPAIAHDKDPDLKLVISKKVFWCQQPELTSCNKWQIIK